MRLSEESEIFVFVSIIQKQVHALNILRAMYRDTRLGEEVFQFIADGVKAAVTGFGSHLWAVRYSLIKMFFHFLQYLHISIYDCHFYFSV